MSLEDFQRQRSFFGGVPVPWRTPDIPPPPPPGQSEDEDEDEEGEDGDIDGGDPPPTYH